MRFLTINTVEESNYGSTQSAYRFSIFDAIVAFLKNLETLDLPSSCCCDES
jgi:hypothetical protein